MGYTPLFIGPLSEGLRRDLQPFMLPNEAFPVLGNAYEFRGTVYKKGGNSIFGYLGIREEVLATRGAGATVVNMALRWPPVFIGSIVITDGVTTFTDDGIGGFTINPLANGVVNAPTNYVAGTVNITFTAANPGANITATYYAAIDHHSPVMGLKTLDLENSVSTVLMAFDTKMSYKYVDALQTFKHIVNYRTVANPVEWTGNDNDFFYTCNYQNGFFATNNVSGGNFYAITGITAAASAVITIGAHNFVADDQVLITNVGGMTQINGLVGTVTAVDATTITVNINSGAFGAYTSGGVVHSIYKTKAASGDGIRWYDNSSTDGWVNFSPTLSNAAVPEILQGALLIIPYHNRLVCLNTVEGTTYGANKRYTNRARWSQNGTCFQGPILPTGSTPTADTGQWYTTPGRGGFVDAPTNEDIVSAGFVKDTLIVFFERSVWALSYTDNPTFPFYWQKINSERGSESTFSTIEFDNYLLTIGKDALIACDPTGSDRKDLKIPDEVINFNNNNQGYKKINGIRDNFNEFVYWTFVSSNHAGGVGDVAFPNRVLAYNYREDTWAIFRDYYTTFGQHTTSTALTWGNALNPWAAYNIAWGAAVLQDGFPLIVAGNAQGTVHFFNSVARGTPPNTNSEFFSIQDISAANPSVVTCLNHSFSDGDHIFITDVTGIAGINNATYRIENAAANTFTLQDINGNDLQFLGYVHGGTIQVVDQFNITTKNFNPTLDFGKKTRVGYIDLFLQNTSDDGEITLNIYIDEDFITPAFTTIVDTSCLTNPNNEKFWYRVYVNQVGQFFTVELNFAEQQIFEQAQQDETYALYSMIVWTKDAGRLV